jgi:hypothetical protein
MNTYTVLTGESYEVEANSPEEAVVKFFWAYGHIDEEDAIEQAIDNGWSKPEWTEEQVRESSTMTEVV